MKCWSTYCSKDGSRPTLSSNPAKLNSELTWDKKDKTSFLHLILCKRLSWCIQLLQAIATTTTKTKTTSRITTLCIRILGSLNYISLFSGLDAERRVWRLCVSSVIPKIKVKPKPIPKREEHGFENLKQKDRKRKAYDSLGKPRRNLND